MYARTQCTPFVDPWLTLSAIPTKWSNTLKHFVGKLLTNCLLLFYHFVGLSLKELVKHINLFHATALLLYPLKTSENQRRFSDVLKTYRKISVTYRKRSVAWKSLTEARTKINMEKWAGLLALSALQKTV